MLERMRPAQDLLSRVRKITAQQPSILDAGCGNGGSSKLLMDRFPQARMLCLDNSPEMLAAAQEDTMLNGRALVSFGCEGIEDHFSSATSGALYDLIYANASLHWHAPRPAPALARQAGAHPPAAIHTFPAAPLSPWQVPSRHSTGFTVTNASACASRRRSGCPDA